MNNKRIIDIWFKGTKDKVITRKLCFGSNRGDAFSRGFNGSRNIYVPTSILYSVYLAGRKVKRYQIKKTRQGELK